LTDATVTAGNKQEQGFLARESSDEDVVSIVACNVETTIEACVVLFNGSTWGTLKRRLSSSFALDRMTIFRVSTPIAKNQRL
jgi:hypothetical protein